MREGTIFQLAIKPKDFPAGLRLRNQEWGVLFAVDGTTPVGQLRRAFALEEAEIESICMLLVEKGLIRERDVSLTEYMAAQTTASGKKAVTLLELLQGGTAMRALTVDTGKGAPLKATNSPGGGAGSQPVMSAKVTPPPLPAEALAQVEKERKADGSADQEPKAGASGSTGSSGGSGDETRPVISIQPNKQVEGDGGTKAQQSSSAAVAAKPIEAAKTESVPYTNGATSQMPHVNGKANGASAHQVSSAPLQSTSATGSADSSSTVTILPNARPSSNAASMESTSTGPLAGPLPSLSSNATAQRVRMSLKSVVNFVLERASDENAGHLDVYRIFVGVNTSLLRRNGIHSLRFDEDRIIMDAELQHAILSSVEHTLGVSCPAEVFV